MTIAMYPSPGSVHRDNFLLAQKSFRLGNADDARLAQLARHDGDMAKDPTVGADDSSGADKRRHQLGPGGTADQHAAIFATVAKDRLGVRDLT